MRYPTHRTRGLLFSAVLLVSLLLSGCDAEEITQSIASRPTIEDFTGSDQVTHPGESLAAPLSIVVTNDDGPVEGVNVSWSSQEGTLTGDSKTNASGVANATWTLSDEVQRRFAVASGSIASSSVNFVAFVVPADDVVVMVEDSVFDPASVVVNPGTTVTWIWPSTTTNHNVEPIGGSVLPGRSGDPVDGPFLFSQEILFSGLFNYQCVAHGAQGTINAGP